MKELFIILSYGFFVKILIVMVHNIHHDTVKHFDFVYYFKLGVLPADNNLPSLLRKVANFFYFSSFLGMLGSMFMS
jgi:hypothetical protein